jgi:integrase
VTVPWVVGAAITTTQGTSRKFPKNMNNFTPRRAHLRNISSLDEHRAERAIHGTGTLSEAWQVYNDSGCVRRLAPKTREGYALAMRYALSMLPARPNVGDVEDWMVKLRDTRGLSPVTVNAYKRSCEAVMWAAGIRTHDHALFDAFAAAQKLREAPKERRCPPEDALAIALQVARNNAERAFVRLAAIAGLRLGEILGLRRDDVDAGAGVLTVTRQRNRNQRKNKNPHVVALDGVTLALVLWTAGHQAEVVDGRGEHLRGWLFPWGKPYVAGFMGRIRAGLGDRADVYFPRGKTAWHGFRHLGATMVARDTGSAVEVQRFLGDASPGMAMCYMAQVRGGTSVDAGRVARALERAGQVNFSEPFLEGKNAGVYAVTQTPAPNLEASPLRAVNTFQDREIKHEIISF